MTALNLVDTDPAELTVDAVVVGVYAHDGGDTKLLLASGAESVAAAFSDRPGGGLAETLRTLGATGAVGEVTKVAAFGAVTAPLVVAVGLGPEPAGAAPAAETLRRAAGAATRALAGSASVALVLPLSDRDTPTDDELTAGVRAVAEGAVLGAYRFAGYKTKGTRPDPVRKVVLHVPDAAARPAKAAVKRSGTVTAAVTRTRDWINTAPNDLRPPQFAEQAAEAARAAQLDVSVLDEKALAKQGYGGILAVGLGSAAAPRMVRIAYEPAGATRRVALVGKGITFDTGGVSIKPAQGMWEMKSDMSGAAAVVSTMIAIAALKPKVAVVAYAPMAENMASGSAYRPGDVVTMYNGHKVEVLNTDAEGRMILGDAIARACEDEPDYLFEVSTLTGGQVIALGKRIAGVMGTPELCDRVRDAGDRAGEPAWPMPLPEDVRKGMDSEVADISQVNAGMDRAGHMLQGGVFLSEFVAEGVQWAHIDIAGPSYHSGEAFGYWAKGGTGVPVRTLISLLEEIAEER
ncbi:leucyl aminopeptidase [Dactylosporangium siamense]|uniref:Probable cytosol aminopeptidase n=1 Tax=Dactylosporangium siamense TaxID=685454 RepID=A0A919UD23_9ACTN|nr:leucyl aminopeptidase [Dactylosporangium siamense]GIG50997.1 putative cytosol aminopeptidase [Dactylosporangium siamense]